MKWLSRLFKRPRIVDAEESADAKSRIETALRRSHGITEVMRTEEGELQDVVTKIRRAAARGERAMRGT